MVPGYFLQEKDPPSTHTHFTSLLPLAPFVLGAWSGRCEELLGPVLLPLSSRHFEQPREGPSVPGQRYTAFWNVT